MATLLFPDVVSQLLPAAVNCAGQQTSKPMGDTDIAAGHTEPFRSESCRFSDGFRVVVVGAGLAGLTAALELAAAGAAVTVLEASARTGGRVCSHAFGDGQIAELGAEWVREDAPALALSLLKAALVLGTLT